MKYSLQCLDLQRKLQVLIEYLEYYAILSVQPINIDKTELLWSARAVGKPTFDVSLGGHTLAWVTNFKYLGYHLSRNLGWGKMLQITKAKIAQRVAIVRARRINGSASRKMQKNPVLILCISAFRLVVRYLSAAHRQTDRETSSHITTSFAGKGVLVYYSGMIFTSPRLTTKRHRKITATHIAKDID